MTSFKRLLAITALTCFATGCTPDTSAQAGPDSASMDGAWTFVELNGKPVPAAPSAVFITFKGDKVNIAGPVNRIGGTLGAGKRFGPMISTRMAGPPELMDYESNLLKALDGATVARGAADKQPPQLLVKKGDVTVAVLEWKVDQPHPQE